MKRSLPRSGFSLVEVTLALGVAAFCLISVMGLLPIGVQTNRAAVQQTTANDILSAVVSDIRTVPKVPNGPGNSSKQFKLYFGNPHNNQPQFLYFSNEGSTGSKSDQSTSDTTFYATISYMPNPAGAGSRTATLVDVKVSWPYNGNTSSTPAGFVETFLSLDRN
jgi:uncharacterized protein (TIGR02598 family)